MNTVIKKPKVDFAQGKTTEKNCRVKIIKGKGSMEDKSQELFEPLIGLELIGTLCREKISVSLNGEKLKTADTKSKYHFTRKEIINALRQQKKLVPEVWKNFFENSGTQVIILPEAVCERLS